jgi:hypothetical protein
MTYWLIGEHPVTQQLTGITMGRTAEGYTEFTTGGLGAYGLPDLTFYADSEVYDDEDPDARQGSVNFLTHIADRVIELGHIPGHEELFVVTDPDGVGDPVRIYFRELPYVYHDILASVSNRAQTIGLYLLTMVPPSEDKDN